ncbi:unnamed protein product [Lasius platythorax]|uniref:Uncharacterized protein n=1 Tax=Lasius platythorax TaxID=488582 RepID=A0AAV2MWE7_9HYME
MFPAAEETTLEELAEVPVIDQAQDVPNAEPEVIEQNPDEHQGHNPDKNREENPDENREKNPDVHREEDSQANVDNVGEQPSKEDQRQTLPVNLKYIV